LFEENITYGGHAELVEASLPLRGNTIEITIAVEMLRQAQHDVQPNG
jgi:hypothetical protein